MRQSLPVLGGLELGGTRPDDIRMRISLPTGDDPPATLRRIEELLRNGIARHGDIAAALAEGRWGAARGWS